MKWCLDCGAIHTGADFTCPACGRSYRIDPLTFTDLYKAYADPLRRFVRRLAADRGLPESLADTEGIVHDTFMVLLRGSRQPIRNPAAWLFTVARNQVSKAAATRPLFAPGDLAGHVRDGSAAWASLAPRADAEEIRAACAVMRAIAGLPDHQRIATYLRQVQGWSLTEIGEYLNCAAATAGVHIHRGTTRIRLLEAIAIEDRRNLRTPYCYSEPVRPARPAEFSPLVKAERTRRRMKSLAILAAALAAAAALGIAAGYLLGMPRWLEAATVMAAGGAAAAIPVPACWWLWTEVGIRRRQRRFNRWLRTGRAPGPPAGIRRS